MQTGYMIAVEGTDKSGKHTQVMNIINYLRERRIAAETLDFPQYNAFFGQMIKNYLGGKFGGTRNLPAEYTMLPYALDRLQFQPQIQQWLRDGKWVILDRYTYSNAFSVAKCPREQWDEKIKFMEKLEFNQMGITRPDHNIYLYLDPRVAYGMRYLGLKPHQNGKPDMHESDFKLLYDTSNVYRQIANANPNTWTIINEMKPDNTRMTINEVFEHVRATIDRLIRRQFAR